MKRLIIIPFNVSWDWSTDYLNQTAFELANKDDVVVCFLWADRLFLKDILLKFKLSKLVTRHSNNIYLVKPLFFVPFRRFKFIENLNFAINILFARLLCEIIFYLERCKKKVFWIFDPNFMFMYKYFDKKYYLLYDCVDFFAVGSAAKVKVTKTNEKTLVKMADLVTANSVVLQTHLRKYRKDIHLVVQGFRSKGFVVKKNKFIDLNLKKPIIGFIGGINNRLDTKILYTLIANNPKWNFVLWGPSQKDIDTGSERFNEINSILSLPNVKTGVSTDKEEIPGLISQFDVGIIPYDINQDFNKYCYPMKLFELFYLGKPVVSTDIIELRRFPDLVKICKNAKEMSLHINSILTDGWPLKYKNKEKKLAIENSWENKIAQIYSLIKSPR